MKQFLLLLTAVVASKLLLGQSIGIGTSAPNASAQLDVTSTTKGLLIPRMTSAQRTAIASPAAGLMVYETTTNSFWFYNGTAWTQIGTGGVSPWTTLSNNIYNTNTGRVGIGTTSPVASAELEISSTNTGLLIPRMTSVQRLAIASPATGLMVYETTTNSFWYYNSVAWNQIGTGGASPWTVSGTTIYSSNTGNVGIGISAPVEKLHIVGDFRQDNGTVTLNNAASIIQFQNAGVDKTFMQLSGNNLRMGTSIGNDLGKMIIRMDGSDKVIIDSTGNMQILGEQDASLTTHGFLTLGSLTGSNIIMDNNEIMARSNGAANDLVLQNDGGNLGIGVASPDERLTLTNNIKLNGSAGLIKFEAAVGGTGSPLASLKYAPGLLFVREGTTTGLGKIEYVDTASFTNFMRIRMGSNVENGITLNTSNYTGLGTASPLARLHVRGEGGIDEIAINSGVGIGSESAAIQFYSTFLSGGGANEKKGFLLLDDVDLKIGTNSGNNTGKFIIRNNGADRVFVDDNGNVGIGVSSPTFKLSVAGNASITNPNQNALSLTGGLTVIKSGEAIKIDGISPAINFYEAGNFKSFISHSASGLYLGVNNGNIRLDVTNGHVAIGTVNLTGVNADAYKLAVAGKVICEEVRVKLASSGWPDYVFSNNYKLPSLAEVETFIDQHKHLPNVPSAAEVEKDGIAVGDMQKRMMEKIEELTLYVIELQKQVDQLKKHNTEK
jgi:hypothetical protein